MLGATHCGAAMEPYVFAGERTFSSGDITFRLPLAQHDPRLVMVADLRDAFVSSASAFFEVEERPPISRVAHAALFPLS